MVHVVGRRAFARCLGGLCALIGLGALAVGCAKASAPSEVARAAGSAAVTTEEKPLADDEPQNAGAPRDKSSGGYANAAPAKPALPRSPMAAPQAAPPPPPEAEAQSFGMIGVMGGGAAGATAAGGVASPAPTAAAKGDSYGAVARLPRLDPNARYATTYRPGGAALAAFDAAVGRGSIPVSYKDLVGDFGSRYAPPIAKPAASALAFQIDTERAAVAPGGGTVNLRIAMRSNDAMPPRAPLSVHLVLDVSGSMEGAAIDNARKAAETLVGRLEPQDDFSLVTFSSDARVLVPDGAVGPRRAWIVDQIRHVRADGGTNISAGLDLGYRQAHAPGIDAESVKIVMLLSDGHANAGDTNPESLAERSAHAFQDGVQTSSFGLGGDFDASLMSTIADRGAGGYYYLADPTQIAPALGRELDARLVPAAQAVEVRVRLRPDVVPVKVFGSRMLDGAEAMHVREQEIAADRNVRKHDGIAQDRKDDAEGGMRFFMPAFARDDRHAMLITLALPPGVGERAIGSVEVRYKDRIRHKNATDEIPVRIKYAGDEAASAATANASVAATVQAFAAGDAILAAAERVDHGDRASASRLLDERAELLKRASSTLHAPSLAEDGLRLARLSRAVNGDGRVEDALPLAVLLRGSGYGYLR
jgi:uncharacterized protein YegL